MRAVLAGKLLYLSILVILRAHLMPNRPRHFLVAHPFSKYAYLGMGRRLFSRSGGRPNSELSRTPHPPPGGSYGVAQRTYIFADGRGNHVASRTCRPYRFGSGRCDLGKPGAPDWCRRYIASYHSGLFNTGIWDSVEQGDHYSRDHGQGQ